MNGTFPFAAEGTRCMIQHDTPTSRSHLPNLIGIHLEARNCINCIQRYVSRCSVHHMPIWNENYRGNAGHSKSKLGRKMGMIPLILCWCWCWCLCWYQWRDRQWYQHLYALARSLRGRIRHLLFFVFGWHDACGDYLALIEIWDYYMVNDEWWIVHDEMMDDGWWWGWMENGGPLSVVSCFIRVVC